jgi:dTDP-4-amino-4,6-dideoxygalactose transaminase
MRDSVRIPIMRPALDDREADAAGRVIRSGWVTQGPEVALFEQEFAAFVGARHACAVSSCTTALHLALEAAGVGAADEVVTVSHSFIASANAARYCGAIPVFVDIDPRTFNMDPAAVEQAITSKTAAILCVHQMGMPCDLSAILDIGERHGIPVIEDAACAIGSEVLIDGSWERIGRPRGLTACFSFHPRKLVTCGDGGMITTNDPALDARVRRARQHGMSASDLLRHGSSQVVFESYTEVGYNYRLTDIQAAVGREQLAKLPQIVSHRRQMAARYKQLLASMSGLRTPLEPEWARSNWQSYCVRLPSECDQRQVMQRLLDGGVATRRGVMCAHREPAYTTTTDGWRAAGTLRHSEEAQDSSIMLPLYHQLTDEDLVTVTEALRRACGR